jgi:DtxR family Mn-dependent transcriptional regulator
VTDKATELSESLEDYLETILDLENTNKVARVKDIADKLGVLRGSVTGALKTLAEKDLINYEPYSYITLTRRGLAIAREVSRRHTVIRTFLENVLLLEPERAEANACRMEHGMDKVAIDRLVQFIDYIQECPRAGDDWIQGFVNYYTRNELDETLCKACVDRCAERYLNPPESEKD